MHFDGKSRQATGIAVLILLTAFSRPLWSQAADESGTLVIVARTANAVIVGVDSKITPHNPTAALPAIPATLVSGDRKLVNVGELSACALDGNLGANEVDRDMSASLRLWTTAHPKTEAREAIDALLHAAAKAWDNHGYTLDDLAAQTPPRKLDSKITTLTCGEFFDGHPIILVGETVVKAGGPSGQHAETNTFEEEVKTVLYMGGAFPTAHYFTTLIGAPTFLRGIDGWETNDSDRAVRQDIGANTTAMAALFKWYTTPSTLTTADLKDLLVPTFASVEKHFSEVGTPNNVRILTAYGRSETTVEGDWPTCSPSSGPATKKE
jgi:hypothetical protein